MEMIKIRVRCMEASVVHVTVGIKGIPGASAKSNEVVKAVENV